MKVVGEGTFLAPLRAFEWSPTVDLCVFVTAKEVSAHRLTGQKVWTVSCNTLHSPDLEFTHIAWREDGKVIATGLDDGSVYIWDVQDGRRIRKVMLNSTPQGPISCLTWKGEDPSTAQDLNNDLGVDFDVAQYLPRIKPIGRTDQSQLSDDTISEKRTSHGKSPAVDIVFIGSESGQLEMSVFGTFSLAQMDTNYSNSRKLIIPAHHCTTPDLALHAIIGRSSTSTNLYLNILRNRTILNHGKYLRQLTTSSTTLSALISYLESTWTSIIEEYVEVNKVKSETISKLRQFVNEDPVNPPPWWNENMKTDVEGAMLGLLMTGVSEPGVVKWFEEKFATVQNVRKWEKRISDGYDAIKTFIHEHIFPVCERIGISLSRLRGVSIWSNQAQLLPLDATSIETSLEMYSKIFKRSHELLHAVFLERQTFEPFTTWLTLIAEDIFAHPDATVDPPPLHTVDTQLVATYISDHLEKPILHDFSSDLQETSGRKDGYLSMIRQLSEILSGYFRHAAGELKEGVTWALSDWIDLEINDQIASSDVRLVIKNQKSMLQVAIALPKQSEARIFLFEIKSTKDLEVDISNPMLARLSLSSHISSNSVLRDVKFLDEGYLVAIASPDGDAQGPGSVVSIDIDDPDLFEWPSVASLQNPTVRDAMEIISKEGEATWLPHKAACAGREMGSNLCVVDSDGRRFKMIDMTEE